MSKIMDYLGYFSGFDDNPLGFTVLAAWLAVVLAAMAFLVWQEDRARARRIRSQGDGF